MRVQDLAPIAIAFVVVAIVLGVGADVLDDIQTSGDDDTTTVTLTNETTTTVVNGTGATFSDYQTWMRNCALTADAVYNVSESGMPITSGNYTITGCSIAFTSAGETDATYYNHTLWNITGSYAYSTDNVAYNSSQYGLEGLQTLAEWLPTIALVIAAAVVIGVIVTYFMFRTGVG